MLRNIYISVDLIYLIVLDIFNTDTKTLSYILSDLFFYFIKQYRKIRKKENCSNKEVLMYLWPIGSCQYVSTVQDVGRLWHPIVHLEAILGLILGSAQ